MRNRAADLELRLVIWPHAKFVGRLGNRRRVLNLIKINLPWFAWAYRARHIDDMSFEDFVYKELMVTYLHELVHWFSGVTRCNEEWDRILSAMV